MVDIIVALHLESIQIGIRRIQENDILDLTDKKVIRALREIKRREEAKQSLLDSCFPEQLEVINDDAKYISVLCTRRSGKTYLEGLRMIKECLAKPYTKVAYISLTHDRCRRVMLEPVLKKINRKHHLGMMFTTSPLKASFPNGSSIVLQGVDDNEDERNKLLGEHFKGVCLDECASFTINLQKLIDDFIGPTLIDDRGWLMMVGTPGNVKNYFYKVTAGEIPGWKNYFWTGDKNTAPSEVEGFTMADLFQEEINRRKLENPYIEEDPGFQQMYRGRWVADLSAKVFKVDQRNIIDTLPEGSYTSYLGIDLGEEDHNAFVVQSYRDNDPTCYTVESFSKNHMTMDEIADKTRYYQQKYDIAHIAIDEGNKQFVEELRRRTGIQFTAAHKTGKLRYIALLNSALINARVKIVKDMNVDLLEELDTVVYVTGEKADPLHPRIKDGQKDHLCDSFLYSWRASYNYLEEPVKPTSAPTEADLMDQYWEKAAHEVQNPTVEPDFLQRDFQTGEWDIEDDVGQGIDW